jgi:hypothetical protein
MDLLLYSQMINIMVTRMEAIWYMKLEKHHITRNLIFIVSSNTI